MTAKKPTRTPRPIPAAKKPSAKKKTTPTKPIEKETPPAPTEEVEAAVEEVEEVEAEETAPDSSASEPASDKSQAPKKRQIIPQAPSIVRAIVQTNDLLRQLCFVTPDKKEQEVSTTLEAAVASTNEDPVAIESAFQLLQGLGLGNFVYGRRSTVTRFVWFVGNIMDVIQGADEYKRPKKLTIQKNLKLRYSVTFHISAEQRAALCKDLGMKFLSRDDLKQWTESTIYETLNMLVDASKEAAK